MDKLGVLIVGVNGAVSSTLLAGIELMRQDLVPRIGMLTERTNLNDNELIANAFEYTPLDKLVFAGWDLQHNNVYDAACQHKVLSKEHLNAVRTKLELIQPWPAVFQQNYVENISGSHITNVTTYREEIQTLITNINAFKQQHQLQRLVMLNLASTERYAEINNVHQTLSAFEQGLDNNDPEISPAQRYFYVANHLHIPYCSFTPSLTNIPALAEQADIYQNLYAGMDGKTGQTLIKSVLASMLRIRRLRIDGWYSTNILGNNDGLALDAEQSNKTKTLSKKSVLDSIMGYPVENHQVHIHYYKPRGDSKEAWDNIDIRGFADIPMQIKVNLLGQDSALAAPLLIDLIRLLDIAKQKGEVGIQKQLSLFFKAPYCKKGETPIHDLFQQEQLLLHWIHKHSIAKVEA